MKGLKVLLVLSICVEILEKESQLRVGSRVNSSKSILILKGG